MKNSAHRRHQFRGQGGGDLPERRGRHPGARATPPSIPRGWRPMATVALPTWSPGWSMSGCCRRGGPTRATCCGRRITRSPKRSPGCSASGPGTAPPGAMPIAPRCAACMRSSRPWSPRSTCPGRASIRRFSTWTSGATTRVRRLLPERQDPGRPVHQEPAPQHPAGEEQYRRAAGVCHRGRRQDAGRL